MKSHRQFIRRLRRLAIGLVAIGALVSVSAASALQDPGSSPSPANVAAKVGDTPADFPGASRAPSVALNAAAKVGDTPADFPGASGAPDVRADDDPGRPARAHRSCATSTRCCRSRSRAPRC